MKIIFISTSIYILFLMKTQLKATWDEKLDSFRVEFLVGIAIILACLFHYETHHSIVREVGILVLFKKSHSFSWPNLPQVIMNKPYSPLSSSPFSSLYSRYFGLFLFILKVWPFYRNYINFQELEKQKLSQHITYLPSELIEDFTF